MDRSERLKVLSERLLPAQFDSLVFALNAPEHFLSSPATPQATRSVELLRWAESSNKLADVDREVMRLTAEDAAPQAPVDSGCVLRAQEFLALDWTTYAITELRGVPDIYDGSPTVVERFDRLTGHLARGDARARRQASKMIVEWCKRNPDHDWTSVFRLRRALCLTFAKEHKPARREVEILLRDAPDSPTLHCLAGVLAFSDRDYDKALEAFQTAMKLEEMWVEPRLQMLDVELLLGRFERALEEAERIAELDELTSRERLIVKTYLIIAKTLTEPAFYQSEEYKAASRDAEKLNIVPWERESWFVHDVAKVLRQQQHISASAREELLELLRGLHRKLNNNTPSF